MRIQVKAVSPVVKEKSYYYFVLEYKKDGKDEKPKKIMSFTEAAYKALKDAKEGDNFDVTLTKDDNGYWQWKDVVSVSADAPMTAGSAGTGKAGNWETSEERARRQILIVRQSCLAQAVASGFAPDAALTLDIAATFETWVNRE